MLTVVVVLKALVEVALFVLVGQGILAAFAGARRHENFIYRLLEILSSPVVRVARWVSPRFVLDAHLPLVALLLLALAWTGLVAAKVYLVKFAGAQ